MKANQEHAGIKEYADGWITERTGTGVPGFLKLAFAVIAAGCTAYLIVYMNGETTHAERGFLVQRFNEATQSSSAFMYAVAALAVVFTVVLVAFAVRKVRDH